MTTLRQESSAVVTSTTASTHSMLINGLTRRHFVSGTTLAALMARSGRGQTPAISGSGTRGVETDKGAVTVPARAERVVCADFFGAFAVVDLGLVPIGAGGSGFGNTGEPYATLLADVPSIGDFLEPDVEAIAVANPDLILRTIDTEDALYDQLSGIAPTVVLSFQSLSLSEVAIRVGEVLGREEEAAALLADYQQRCDFIATDFEELLANTTFAFAMPASESTFWTLGPAWTDTTVMLDAGLTLAEPLASQADSFVEHSLEGLGILKEADVIFIDADADGRTATSEAEILTSSPLWQSLPAVQAGNVFAIPYGASSLGAGIVLVDRLEEILTALSAI